MSTDNQFNEQFNVATKKVIASINKAMSEGMNFCCQLANISRNVKDEIHYPSDDAMRSWIKKLFEEKLFVNESLRNLLLVVVTGSDTGVNLGIYVPESESMVNARPCDEFIKSFMDQRTGYESCHLGNVNCVEVNYMCEFPFKERDAVLQSVFNELKKRKIYVDDEDDVMYFLDDEQEEDLPEEVELSGGVELPEEAQLPEEHTEIECTENNAESVEV